MSHGTGWGQEPIRDNVLLVRWRRGVLGGMVTGVGCPSVSPHIFSAF